MSVPEIMILSTEISRGQLIENSEVFLCKTAGTQ